MKKKNEKKEKKTSSSRNKNASIGMVFGDGTDDCSSRDGKDFRSPEKLNASIRISSGPLSSRTFFRYSGKMDHGWTDGQTGGWIA